MTEDQIAAFLETNLPTHITVQGDQRGIVYLLTVTAPGPVYAIVMHHDSETESLFWLIPRTAAVQAVFARAPIPTPMFTWDRCYGFIVYPFDDDAQDYPIQVMCYADSLQKSIDEFAAGVHRILRDTEKWPAS
jgi:hypothetical protein